MSGPAELSTLEQSASGSGFEVQERGVGAFDVRVWGDLGLGWFGRLATALAQHGLNIESAQALRERDSHWTGLLQLTVGAQAADPRALDYVALCRESAPSQPLASLSCDRHRISRTETGALELRLFAADQLGFLSALLERLQFLGLFPERLRVTTTGQYVDDTLWLRGVAGHPASTPAEQALRDLLNGITRPGNQPAPGGF